MADKKIITPPYDAFTEDIARFSVDDVKRAVIYFASIKGREQRELNEWDHSLLEMEKVGDQIGNIILKYDPSKNAFFAVSFPHVTRIFGWKCGEGIRESNRYDFGEYETDGMVLKKPKPLPEGAPKFHACGLEDLAIAQETRIWFTTEGVEQYYTASRNCLALSLESPNKLRDSSE
jgi:hypothetical protein